MLLLSAVVLVASICLTSSLPGGAPAAACITLTPGHGGTPQAGEIPYVFNLDQFDDNGTLTYTPGETYRRKYSAV